MGASGGASRFPENRGSAARFTNHLVRDAFDHDVTTEAAQAARYRQRRLLLLVALLAATVVPIVAMGAWWLWPLLVVPAVLAAPLAGGTGLIATILLAVIALASASAGNVDSTEIMAGFAAIITVAGLGAAHAGMTDGLIARAARSTAEPAPGMAPDDVFDVIAHRECSRAAAGGPAVSLAVVAIPRVDSVERLHGTGTMHALLDAASAAVVGAIPGSDLVMEKADGQFVALVAGPADAARDVAGRMAAALGGVAVRAVAGGRVTAGAVATGVAEWEMGDSGPDALIERATAAMLRDLAAAGSAGRAEEGATDQFSAVSVADAA